MKKIRQVISLLLSLLMIASTVFGTGVTAFAEENDVVSYLTYEYSSGLLYGEGFVIKDCDTSISGDVVIPDIIDGYPVISVGNQAFSGCHNITSVTIPDTVKNIGSSAFSNCNNIKSVTVGAGVKSMPSNAFGKSVERIEVSENNSTFSSDEYGVVYNKDKTELRIYPSGNRQTVYTIPATVTKILSDSYSARISFSENLAFIHVDDNNAVYSNDEYGVLFNKDKTKLIRCPRNLIYTEYEIPDGVISATEGAFYGCKNLTKVTMGKDMTAVGTSLFSNCTNLTDVIMHNKITTIQQSAFYGCEKLENVDIPESVELIGSSAFNSCVKLDAILLPDSVTTIGDNVFRDCAGLTEVIMSKNITSFGESTFNGCSKLEFIEIPDGFTDIGSYAFAHCSALTELTIPDSVETIGQYAFYDCGITEFVFPEKEITLGSGVFCGSLIKRVVISADIKKVPSSAFMNCHKLTDVIISEGVTTIDDYAFQNCSILETITIPASVTTIGTGSMSICNNLKNVTILNPECEIKDSSFTIYSTATIHGYSGSTAEEYATKYSRTFVALDESNYEVFENFTYEVVDGAVTIISCDENTEGEIVIPETIGEYPVTAIGEGAFDGCVNVTAVTFNDTSVIIADSETTIPVNITINGYTGSTAEEYATKYNRAFVALEEENNILDYLKYRINNGEVTITQGLASISGDVVLPDTIEGYPVTAIGNSAFRDCGNITGLIIPDSVTKIGMQAFQSCKSLAEVTLPGNLTEIGEHGFRACTSLEQITIPGSVKTISYLSFDSCSSLVDIVISEGVQIIDDWAFSNCKNITEIVIPDSVTSIGDAVFGGCYNLSTVKIGKGLTSLDYGAMDSIAKITEFTVDEENEYFSSDRYGVLFNKDKTELIRYTPGHSRVSYKIPDGVTEIAPSAFRSSYYITDVTIPDSVKTIGNRAFYSCNITEIIIPDGVTTIGDNAFASCSRLVKAEIPASITSIDENTFNLCNMLSEVTILNPDCAIYDSEKTIDDSATIFGYSGSTAEEYATKYNRQFEVLTRTGAFENLEYTIVDDSAVITGFDELAMGSVFIPAEIEGFPVTQFSPELFAGNVSIMTVVIPDTVKVIETDSFRGCTLLEKVVATGVETIGEGAFAVCKKLDTVVTFSDTVSIADNAFDGCGELTVFVKEEAVLTAPETANVITFALKNGILGFKGEYKSDLYYLFDLVAVMCAYYDGVEYLFFDSFEVVSADDSHIYYYTEDWQRVEFDGTKAENIRFSVEAFDGEDFKQFTFNELCEKVASGEINNFSLVIEEADGLVNGSIEISLVEQINMTIQRILKALTNLINKLFSFFKKLGV